MARGRKPEKESEEMSVERALELLRPGRRGRKPKDYAVALAMARDALRYFAEAQTSMFPASNDGEDTHHG